MGLQTPLYEWHCSNGGKMVDFSGWQMPINYGSQIQEHHAVRQRAGMFDVSHMTVVDIHGGHAKQYLQYLLANDVATLDGQPGKALYTGMLNEQGGVIDDLIVYYMISQSEPWYRLVVNCGTRAKDLAWMEQCAVDYDVSIQERADLAMFAVQGPEAVNLFSQCVGSEVAQQINSLDVFQGIDVGQHFYARTGYTGEDGLEVILPADDIQRLWVTLLEAGVQPCGLGARDTLRLEAGMNLYGNEMDDNVSPLSANMAWTIAWEPQERNFIGRNALVAQKAASVSQRLIGLVMKQKGVLRAHQKVVVEGDDGLVHNGEITSGTFSPTLGYSIALARIPAGASGLCQVEIRNKLVPVERVKPCFVRHGKAVNNTPS